MVARLANLTSPGSKLPPAAIPALVVLCVFGVPGPNFFLALLALAVLVVGTALLWRPGETPILYLIFMLSWLQGSMAIFYSNWLSIDINEFSHFGDIRFASILSLIGGGALAVGMRIGAKGSNPRLALAAREMALSQPLRTWFRLYLASIVMGASATIVGSLIPGITQLTLPIVAFKWAFYYMLIFATFIHPRGNKWYFLAAFGTELFLSIGSYFSDFKTVFYVTILAALVSGAKYSLKTVVSLSVLGALFIMFAVVWSAVKLEYRGFVAGGQRGQVVAVDTEARLAKLADLIGGLGAQGLNRGVDLLIRRISYVEFFAAVMSYVPEFSPHEHGAIIWDAIVRPFTPRILFPEKSIVDDSARTNYYTGGIAGDYQDTSISLGYVAESFIDFGQFGMMLDLLVLGAFYGRIYRYFLNWRASRGLLGMAAGTAILLGVGGLETSITKSFGGVIASVLIAWLIISFVIPWWAPWLAMGRRKAIRGMSVANDPR